jgi:hypothetical protein
MKKAVVITLLLALLVTPLLSAPKFEPIKFSLSVGYVGLGIADTALTIHGTKYLGLIETNTLLAPFFRRGRAIDYFAIWNIQLVCTVAFLAITHFIIRQDSTFAKITGYALLVTGVIVRGCVVAHNARLNRMSGGGGR